MSDGVLSASWRSRLLKKLRAPILLCFRCEKEIDVGARIHINNGSGRIKKIVRVYHAECFEAMFID